MVFTHELYCSHFSRIKGNELSLWISIEFPSAELLESNMFNTNDQTMFETH